MIESKSNYDPTDRYDNYANEVSKKKILRTKIELHNLGYPPEYLEDMPEDLIVSFGCGCPIKWLDLPSNSEIIEIGCGTGLDAILLSKYKVKKGKVVAIDPSCEMLQIAKRNSILCGIENIKFILNKFENLEVKDIFYEGVIANCVINICCCQEKVYKKAYGLLRIGGILSVAEPALMDDYNIDTLPKHHDSLAIKTVEDGKMLTLSQLRNCIMNAGFSNLEIMTIRYGVLGGNHDDYKKYAGLIHKKMHNIYDKKFNLSESFLWCHKNIIGVEIRVRKT